MYIFLTCGVVVVVVVFAFASLARGVRIHYTRHHRTTTEPPPTTTSPVLSSCWGPPLRTHPRTRIDRQYRKYTKIAPSGPTFTLHLRCVASRIYHRFSTPFERLAGGHLVQGTSSLLLIACIQPPMQLLIPNTPIKPAASSLYRFVVPFLLSLFQFSPPWWKKKRKVRKERTEREENLSHSDFRAWRNETRFDELSPLGLACSSEPHVLKAYCKFYGVDLYFRLSSRGRTKKTASFFTTRKTRKVYRCIRKCIFCLCALPLELSLAFYKIRRFVKS